MNDDDVDDDDDDDDDDDGVIGEPTLFTDGCDVSDGNVEFSKSISSSSKSISSIDKEFGSLSIDIVWGREMGDNCDARFKWALAVRIK